MIKPCTERRVDMPSGPAGRGPVAYPMRVGVMPPLAPGYITRTESVPDLPGMLVPGAAIALIPGLPWSCGKTQLAVWAAEQLWRSRAADLLVWVSAASRASVLSGYVDAARAVGLDDRGDAEQAASRLLRWLAATGRRWLVVLDDVRDAAEMDGLWPFGPAGSVLITAADAAAVCVPARTAEVGAFSVREAMSFLNARLTADVDQRAGALDLATELGCHPAALGYAAAVIADSDMTCRDYRDLLTGDDAGAVTWILSARHAGLIAPGGATWPLLVLLSVLEGNGIPARVLVTRAARGYLRTSDPRPLLQAIELAGLAGAGSPAVLVSTSLRAAIRAEAAPDLLAAAVLAAADALAECWPGEETRPYAFWSCAASLRGVAGDELVRPEGCHRVLWLAGQSLEAAGMARPAAAWWQRLVADCERICGQRHRDTLAAAERLATALLASGNAPEAASWAGHVADVRAQIFGLRHPVTIAAQVLLGRALSAAGKPGDAVPVLAGALAASEQQRGPHDAVTLRARQEHAAACLAAGMTGEAIAGFLLMLDACQNTHGPDHPDSFAAGMRLAEAYVSAGQLGAATTTYEQLLAVARRSQGAGDPAVLQAVGALAAVQSAAGRIGDAVRLREEACAGYERALGASHPDTLACRAELARLYWAAGQAAQALGVLDDAIGRSERARGADDPHTMALRQVLAEMTAG